jgi:hypothetical protein
MMDLFSSRDPFNVHNYTVRRNLILIEQYPESATSILEHTQHIINHETNYDMNRTQFDDLNALMQLKALGVKSAPKQVVLTPEQDKARIKSKFAEDDIVGAWASWFKMQYAGVPYVIDRKAQKKSFYRASIEKKQDFKRGNPDIHVQTGRAGFIGLYVEQKKSEEELFYKGTRILKPSTENRHIHQALYHAVLRDQGYWVMFSPSLDATIKITQRYMDGNPYKMQEYDYYCKPEDYPIFADNKHFKPVKDRPGVAGVVGGNEI